MVKMKRTKAILVLIALSLSLLTIETTKGAADEWVISTCDEDVFYAAYPFEGVDIVYLQGEDMQIRSWFYFEGPVLDSHRYIEEAYLSVRTPAIGSTDIDASMTIYGIDQDGTDSFAVNPNQINGPYTTNHYNVNLSSFVGPGVWHNITVTSIVTEISQRHAFWDGHDIAFVGLSADNKNSERSVSSIESGHPAKLYVHYGAAPPPPENVTATWIERLNGLDIYQSWGYENFYEDYTEVDPLGLIWTTEANPYRINFIDFGFEEFWNHRHYFEREAQVGDIWNNLEIRFRATLTKEDAGGYHRPDFYWIFAKNATFDIDVSHYVGPLTTDDHYFGPEGYTTDSGMFMADPIPPSKTQWYSFLWDVALQRYTLRQYLSEPSDWYTDYVLEYNKTAVWNQRMYRDIEVTSSKLGGSTYNGISDGWIDNMIILTDGIPQINGTFFVVDPTTNETLVTDLPDLNATRDWIETNYPDPTDPEPGEGWEESPITRFQIKLAILVVGMVLFVGAPIYGLMERPEAATWVLIFMASICGVALLWSLQTM